MTRLEASEEVEIVLDQPIDVSAEDAQSAFLDPNFYQSLGELPDISAPEVRSFSAGPDSARIELGYRFAGELNGPAKVILDPKKLTWSQVTEVDLATRRSTVRMIPDNYAGLLSFEGWYELHDAGEHKCRQHFEADLRAHIPLLGPLAERAIAGSIRQNLADTAHLIERFVAGHPHPAADGPSS
ncbi:MAG: DUF2505 family protein [Acidimicrobiales bacterium]